MNREKELERLIQDDLDGVATPEESARLRELLARSHEALARRRDLKAVFEALGQVELEDAPEDLRRQVLEAIAAELPVPGPQERWLDTLRAAFRRPAVRLAYSFVGGAVVGCLVFALATGQLGGRGYREMPSSGAMAPSPVPGAPVRVDRAELTSAGAGLAFETWRADDRLQVRVQPLAEGATALGEVEIALVFDPAATAPVGVNWSGGRAPAVELTAGRLRARLGADTHLRVDFVPTGGRDVPIRIEARCGGASAEGALRTSLRSQVR